MKVVIGTDLSDKERAELQAIAAPRQVCGLRDRAAIMEAISEAEVYVTGPWSEDMLAAAPGLKWVHFLWAGVDRSLSPALIESDVTVTNSAGVFAVPMAEHVMALMLAFSRGLNVSMRRPHDWRSARKTLWNHLPELGGATLGVVGYGGIGRESAKRAKALGMRIVAVRSRAQEPDDLAERIWGPEGLHELLAQSDYVLLSCPLTGATRGLIGAEELACMRPNAILINLGRGAVVDQEALIGALRDGKIGGAGLDVTSPEPLPAESPLWDMENVIVTPHTSGTSPYTWSRQYELLRDNLSRYVRGEALRNVVDKQAGY